MPDPPVRLNNKESLPTDPYGTPFSFDKSKVYEGGEYSGTSVVDLQNKIKALNTSKEGLVNPSFGNFVSNYAQKQVNEGSDYYITGTPYDSYPESRNIQAGDINTTTRGVVRFDPSTLEGDKYIDDWGLGDEDIRRVLSGQSDVIDHYDRVMDLISDRNLGLGKTISTSGRETRESYDEMGNVDGTVDFYDTQRGIFRDTDSEYIGKNPRGFRMFKSTEKNPFTRTDEHGSNTEGENHFDALTIPLGAGTGSGMYDVPGRCTDNMTCIGSATANQTLAAQDYAQAMREAGYGDIPSDFAAFSGGTNFIVSNDNAWGKNMNPNIVDPVTGKYSGQGKSYGLSNDPRWETRLINLEGNTYKDEATGEWKFKEGVVPPSHGDIVAMYGNPFDGGGVHHSGIYGGNVEGRSMLGYGDAPEFSGYGYQDHTWNSTYSKDKSYPGVDMPGNPIPGGDDAVLYAHYVGNQAYQDWLKGAESVYTAKQTGIDNQVKAIEAEIKRRQDEWYESERNKVFKLNQQIMNQPDATRIEQPKPTLYNLMGNFNSRP